jgi:hypothetical protein
MRGFVVTAVFDVDPEVARRAAASGRNVLADVWGLGHRFSYLDGHTLTLVVEVLAEDRAEAFDLVVDRAEQLWTDRGISPLPTPTTLHVQPVLPEAKMLPGLRGRGPDSLIAESAARAEARLRATRAALAELELRSRP